jgi:mannose/fructose/N-acetylgalactosamine-specific phosphotransferase system component IIB
VKESGEIVSKFAEAKKSNVVVLVRNTNDALEVIRNANGVVSELNVGGLRYEEGKQKLTDLIAVSDQDLDNFKKIENLGVNIDFRILPRDKKRLLGDLVKNWS